jgi:hypothetical protein
MGTQELLSRITTHVVECLQPDLLLVSQPLPVVGLVQGPPERVREDDMIAGIVLVFFLVVLPLVWFIDTQD